MRQYGSLLTLVLLAALLAGCRGPVGPGAGKPRPNVLRLAMNHDFRALDPALALDGSNLAVVRLIYRSLLDFDEGVNLVPVLAEALPTLGPDKRTWTVRVRRGVHFTNGREVVAEDFVYSIRRILDPKTKSSGASFLGTIAGAEPFGKGEVADVRGLRAVGRYVLEIETEGPDLTLPYLLALPSTAAVPREEVERLGADFFRNPVGTGPFALDEWKRDLHLRLKRNDRCTLPGPAPTLEAIEFVFGTDDLTRQMMFERGEIDLLELPNGPGYVALKNDPRWQPYLLTRAMLSTWWLAFNCEMAPFRDRKVRRALAHAVDKERALKLVNGRGTIAAGILPPGFPGHNPDRKGPEYDPEKARRLLADAGYPQGIPEPVQLYAMPEGVLMAVALKEDLARVGVTVELQVMSVQVFQGAVTSRGRAACNFWGWSQDFPDPWDFLHVNFHGKNRRDQDSLNYFFFDDAKTNRLLDAAREETDPQRRLRLYQQAEDRILEEAPMVPVYHDVQARPHQPWVKGDAIHPVWYVCYEKLSVQP